MAAPSGVSVQIVVKKNDLPKLPAAVESILRGEIQRGAYAVEASAKQKCPVRTGTLRRSIHTVLAGDGLSATVGPSVEYGIYVELGTRHRTARPYLRPAFELEAPRTIAGITRALRGLG